MTLVKICGITNIEDAIECVRLGANLLGFVFADSPRRADVDTVKHIERIIGGDAKTVGVFTEESDDVISIVNECNLTYAQLHGGQSEDFARRLSAHRVIRVARIANAPLAGSTPLALSRPEERGSYRSAEELDCLSAEFPTAAFYLLDAYKKGIAGGTGETFDWDLAVRAKSLGKPVFLSGGLRPDNVADAIRVVQPYAVDVASGVESCPGKKDLALVKEFIDNVRKADNGA